MHRLLLALLLVCASGFPVAAQLRTPSAKHKHFVDFKCDGQPDKVFGRRDERYFGCVNGRVACSDDGVTQSMIAAYERRRADIISGARQRGRESSARHASRHSRGSISRPSTSSRSSKSSGSVYTVKSAPRQPRKAEPVEADKVRQVAVGASTDEVIALLGQPKFRIAGSSESWTYSLTEGGSAKLQFEFGKVTSVFLPN